MATSPAERERKLQEINEMERGAKKAETSAEPKGQTNASLLASEEFVGADAERSATRVDLTPEEAEEVRRQKKARLTQVLSRGIVNEKLQMLLDAATPSGFRGKFVRDDDESIIRYSNLNYGFTYKKEAAKLLNADGRIRVGDAVLMTIRDEDAALLREIRLDSVKKKLTAGRRDYKRQAAQSEAAGVKSFDDSQTDTRTGTA